MDMIYNFWKGGTKGGEDNSKKDQETKSDENSESATTPKDSIGDAPTPKVEELDRGLGIGETEQRPNEVSEEAKLVDEKGERVHDVSHKAIESAKSIGSFLYSVANKAGRSVSETAKHVKRTVEENTLLADFNKEQEEFLKSKGPKGAGIAPWIGCADEESVKQQILSLSQDKRNFVRSPPSGVQFNFDFEEMYPVATAVLEEDKMLQDMRFELVPKLVTEEAFWRNYFYRVSLVKQSNQLSSLTQERGSSPETDSRSSIDSASDESIKAKKHVDDDDSPLESHEFVSDSYANSNVSVEDIKKGMKQLGVSDRAGHDEEWEKELQQELQEYEVVAQQEGGVDTADWENEIDEMLDAKSKDLPLK